MFDGIIKNMLTDMVRNCMVALAAYLGLTGSTQTQFVAGGIAIAAGLWQWYENGGHQKIVDALKARANTPSLAAAVKSTPLVLVAFLLLAPHSAHAQMATKSPPATTTQCTIIQCTGFYAGGGFAGNGTNADILGSGLSGSVFSAGAIPFIDGGWQYWNNKLFFAVEIGVGDQMNMGGTNIGNEAGVYAYQEAQFGGSLYGLFNAETAPITTPQVLTPDLIAPYVAIGVVERSFANGWSSGAGAKFTIAPNMFLDIGYRYINYGAASVQTGVANSIAQFNAENLVRISVNYKF